MATSVGQLTIEMATNVARLQQDMDKATKSVSGAMQKMKKAAVAAGVTVAIGKITSEMIEAGKQALDLADKYAKTARAIGVSTETLSAYNHVAELSGATFEQLTTGVKQLSKGMLDYTNDTGEAKVALNALGISATNSTGRLKSADEVILEISDKFANMPDGVEKTSYAMKLFGKSGANLIPMLNAGTAGIQEMKDEAAQLGLVFDQKTAEAAERVNDNFTRLHGSVDGLLMRFTTNLLPDIEKITNGLAGAAKNSGELAEGIDAITTAISDGIWAFEKMSGFLDDIQAKNNSGISITDAMLNSNQVGMAMKTWKAFFDWLHEQRQAESDAYGTRYPMPERPQATETSKPREWTAEELKQMADSAKGIKDVWGSADQERIDAHSRALDILVEQDQAAYDKMVQNGIDSGNQIKDSWLSAATESAAADERAKVYEEAQQKDLQTVIDSLMSEEDKINDSYEKRREIILSNAQITEEQRTALEMQLTQQRNRQLDALEAERASMILSNSSALFGSMAELAAQSAGEQSGIYKAMFAVSKAFAIADSIIKIQQGIANAASLSWPANLAAMASVAASTASIVSTISSTNFSGAYDNGGNIPSGSWGIAGEFGPEIVRGPANVTSRKSTADLLGNAGGSNVTVNITNNADGTEATATETQTSDGKVIEVIIQKTKQSIAREFREGGGIVNRAAETAYGLKRGTA